MRIENVIPGRHVVIDNTDKCYSSYDKMANMLGLTNWHNNDNPCCGDLCTIVSGHPHPSCEDCGEFIVGVTRVTDGKQFLMGYEGLSDDCDQPIHEYSVTLHLATAKFLGHV